MAFISGTEGNDVLSGTPQTDLVDLKGGNDAFFASSGNDVVLGGFGNDSIRGDSGNDDLSGEAGSDFLVGGSGNDKLSGGSGNDLIDGGSGVDTLTGGSGADRFDYNALSESGLGAGNRDIIQDFTRGLDKIDLSSIDANANLAFDQAFTFIGGAEFSFVAGQARTFISSVTGNLCIAVDVHGDGLSDLNIELPGVSFLSASDFVL